MYGFIPTARLCVFAVIVSLCFVAQSSAQNSSTELAPDFFLYDLEGNAHSLSQYQGKYVVLEWLNFQCRPVDALYKNGYLPTIQQRFTEQNAVWLSVISGETRANPGKLLRQVEKRGGWQTAVLLDDSGEVGRMYGASKTPHIFLVSPEGRLTYEGAVDNQPVVNESPEEGSVNYLDQAFLELQGGRPVSIVSTAPYGCPVNY